MYATVEQSQIAMPIKPILIALAILIFITINMVIAIKVVG